MQNVQQGSTLQVDLANASALTVDWGPQDCDATLLITLVYTDNTTSVVGQKQLLYPGWTGSASSCTRSDGTVAASGTSLLSGDAQGLKYTTTSIVLTAGAGTIPADNTVRLARIKPLYSDTTLRVSGTAVAGQQFAYQSYTILATGTSTRGNESRKVQVERTLPVAPSVLDFVLFSGNTIVK
jgi:hypothetical protein